MANISYITKQIVKENQLLDEYLKRGIINYIALSEQIKPRIESEVGKRVNLSTIAMALRRLSTNPKFNIDLNVQSLENPELIMKGNLSEIVVYKSTSLFERLIEIYNLVDYNKGDTLNIVHGNYDVAIIINEKFEKKCLSLLKNEKLLHIERDLVALTLKFGKSFLHIPGIYFLITKQLVLENINLIEIVSSLIEITFMIGKKDSTKAYRALQEFIEQKENGNSKTTSKS